MSTGGVTGWLAGKVATERRIAFGVAVGGALGGAVALLLTFASTYAAVWFISFSLLHISSGICLAVTLALVVALFIGNLTTRREYLESYTFTTGTAEDKVVSFGKYSNINPIAPDSAHSYLKMLVSLLFTAPRLIMEAIHNVRRAKRLARLDVEGCGAILAFLLEREKRVALTEIAAAFPGLTLEKLFPQLAEISGVLFLKSEPSGLSVSTDLRREMAGSLR